MVNTANAAFTIFALDLTVVRTFFCTKLVKSKFGSNQIFRALFAASGSEGLQVLFSGTGFVCCQGSPLFLTG